MHLLHYTGDDGVAQLSSSAVIFFSMYPRHESSAHNVPICFKITHYGGFAAALAFLSPSPHSAVDGSS